ncbi:MAG: hypothetical protein ACQES9_08060 [Myxococcota bacterium]
MPCHYRSHKKRYLRWYRNRVYTRSYEYENYDDGNDYEDEQNDFGSSGYSQPEPSTF